MIVSYLSVLFFVGLGICLVSAQPSVSVMRMIDMPPSFQPVQVKIRVGDTVKWENVGNAVHHASSDPSVALKADEVANPSGAKPFDSGFLRPGESFSQTFTIAGVYYTCVVHEMSGMNGEVIVIK
jgi:plastocyanin